MRVTEIMDEHQKEQAEMVRVFFKNFMPDVNYTVIIDDWLFDDKLIITTLRDNFELMRNFQNEYLKLRNKKRINKNEVYRV